MRNRKQLFILIGVICAAIVLAVILAIYFLSPATINIQYIEDNISIPYKRDAGDDAARYFESVLTDPPQEETTGSILESKIIEHMTYSITESDESTATVEITSPDMDKLIDDMRKNASSYEDGAVYLNDRLDSGDFDVVTAYIVVEFDENGNPVDPYALTDAVYGGLLTKMEELLAEAGMIE